MAGKNGYSPSILSTESGRCYICRSKTETARHEIFYGVKNRKTSKEHGFWLDICPECHQRVHDNPGRGFDRILKQKCQKIYEKSGSRDDFRELVGRSYL